MSLRDKSHEELCVDPKLVAEVTRRCQAACKGKLVGFEIPKKIGLVSETWTPENDLLTAAMKLKRIPICKKHAAELDVLYK
jgi:long-chain acyl-CoA synthetase